MRARSIYLSHDSTAAVAKELPAHRNGHGGEEYCVAAWNDGNQAFRSRLLPVRQAEEVIRREQARLHAV